MTKRSEAIQQLAKVAKATKKLEAAWSMVIAAENLEMASDGPIRPTREVFSNKEFDVMARLVRDVLRLLKGE